MAIHLVTPLLLAGASAAIGSYFQDRSSKLKRERSLHDQNIQSAFDLYHKVFTSAYRYQYLLSEECLYVALRSAISQPYPADQSTWDQFQRTSLDWNGQVQQYLTQVDFFFGSSKRDLLEEIKNMFAKASTKIQQTFYQTSNSLIDDAAAKRITDVDDIPKEVFRAYFDHVFKTKEVNQNLETLNKLMMSDISKGRIGEFK